MRYQNGEGRGIWGMVVGVVSAIVLVSFLFSVRIVDQSKTCAIVRLGRVVGQAQTGFQLVTPIITGLDCYSRQVTVYQTGDVENKQADYWDVPVEVKTSDGQTAYLSFNVSFHVNPENVVNVRSNVASDMKDLKERVVANYSRSMPRDIAPQYSATQLYTAGRVEFEKEVRESLLVEFAKYGVALDDFTLRDVNFSDDYERAIEAQQIARERIETEQYNSQAAVFEAQKVVEQAKGSAQATIEQAKGNAEATRIQAEADATALNIKGAALQNNPQILNLEFIQSLKSATWMMVPWSDMQGYLPVTPPTQ